jgi:hypothetical protein
MTANGERHGKSRKIAAHKQDRDFLKKENQHL